MTTEDRTLRDQAWAMRKVVKGDTAVTIAAETGAKPSTVRAAIARWESWARRQVELKMGETS